MRIRVISALACPCAILGCAAAGARAEVRHARVVSTLALSPSGSARRPLCTRAAPCRSFNRAYRAARPGQVVELTGGSYGRQLILPDPRKGSGADVVFPQARGTNRKSPWDDQLTVDARPVTLSGFRLNGDWRTDEQTRDVTFRNVTVAGGHLHQIAQQGIRVIGGSISGAQRHQAADRCLAARQPRAEHPDRRGHLPRRHPQRTRSPRRMPAGRRHRRAGRPQQPLPELRRLRPFDRRDERQRAAAKHPDRE